MFDDVIEFTGPACAKYQGVFLQPLAVYVKDKSPEVFINFLYCDFINRVEGAKVYYVSSFFY